MLFFHSYGHKLEELRLYGDKVKMKQILKLCPNVKTAHIQDINIILDEDKEFLPKLENIFINLTICPKNVNQLKILSDKYSKTMKTLNVTLKSLTAEDLKTCFDCISRFENLLKLTLELKHLNKLKDTIDDCLSLIGQKCNKLLKLDLIGFKYQNLHKEPNLRRCLRIKNTESTEFCINNIFSEFINFSV